MYEELISRNTSISQKQVLAVLKLLDEGATIPFIARYRKEVTGSLDETELEKISYESIRLKELEKRKKSILEKLQELNVTNEALLSKIRNCQDSAELEDLYLPYKVKRVTKATKARQNGLEPLAKIIMSQRQNDIMSQAYRFAKNGLTADEALEGARHIIAEWINENEAARGIVRRNYQNYSSFTSKVVKGKKDEAAKYRDYFDFSQSLKRIPSHRALAAFRGEKEGLLKVQIVIDKEDVINRLNRVFIKTNSIASEQVKLAVKDSLSRLLGPSLENETRASLKAKADEEAIGIFASNVNQLLLAPPLGSKEILAIDPGFKSGCKMVCLNKQGGLVSHTTIFPHPPIKKSEQAKTSVLQAIAKHQIKAIAIGNGTAGRETEDFIKSILPKNSSIEVYLISEAGASIYSASETAREEFPNLDLTYRGAISIGRRLMDPLAELVKLDPKNIGVGQYQHDVAQDKLKLSLDNTVSFAVNKVGVNLNTASKHLLQYVAGCGPKLAQNIVEHRKTIGHFTNKKELNKVKGFGKKAFEQAAGFIRIKNGSNPLDASGVHPESHSVVKEMAKSINCQIEEIIGADEKVEQIQLNQFVSEKIGLPTLTDIINELKKPGIDPRGAAKAMAFDDSIRSINDIRIGMQLQGKVTNLTKFGAFVDIGVKENGLIHISHMSSRRISDPSEVLRLDQVVSVRVLDVDLARKRISLGLDLV